MNRTGQDHSSTRPGGSRIQWRQWSPSAFSQAQAENKPILLYISAVWCYWCHVMEEETFVDPDVVSYVSENFIPVWADNDHRPEINARYNLGGWPTTAILTAHGDLVGGATYLPPDQLLGFISEVRRGYQEQKAQLYDQARGFQRQRQEQVAKVAAGDEPDAALVDRIARRICGIYDARNGGFGDAPKFPSGHVLRLLLHLFRTTGEPFYRAMLEKTLDGMASGAIYDRVEGAFFRYSEVADWSQAQHEKMLEDNVVLAGVYLDASILLDNEEYRRVAVATIEYLISVLFDSESSGFRGSQGSHSHYFALPPEERAQHPAPPPDPYCYSGWSAQAASLLLEASWKLGHPQWAETALAVIERVDGKARAGRLHHAFTGEGPDPDSSTDLLADWAHLLNALLYAHAYTDAGEDYLERGRQVADRLLRRFLDSDRGGFFDIEKDENPVGLLRVREKPLPENIAAVTGLARLHYYSPAEEYRQAVQRTLSAYLEAHLNYGEFAAEYAVAVDQWLSPPVEVTIEGRPDDAATSQMVEAAHRLPSPHLVIKTMPAGAESPAQAHVCLNTVCLPPVRDPAALASAVQSAPQSGESPFENILDRFVNF